MNTITHFRLADGSVVPASKFNGILPPGARIHVAQVMMDQAPPDGQHDMTDAERNLAAAYGYATVSLADAQRNAVSAHGAGTEWLVHVGSMAGKAKHIIADAASGDPVLMADAARRAADLANQFTTFADRAESTAQRAAILEGAGYLKGIARGAHALTTDGASLSLDAEGSHKAMCDHLSNAWRS